ncbi:MAG: metallophosphoesterase family protein [Akkermansiaceae bacterium]
MRTLAIGDIHGSCNALKTLSEYVGFESDDVIVTLGDYIDRGPDSKGVIDFLIELGKTHKLVTLKGNHEVMLENAPLSEQELYFWLYNGGDTAMASFGATDPFALKDQIPPVYWDFFKSCKSYHETNGHILVHAGLDPDVDPEDQDESFTLWQRIFDTQPHKSGKTIVCGHTPQHEGYPLVLDHAICIDTFACRGGWLTCLDIDSGQYWQASETGETRQGTI